MPFLTSTNVCGNWKNQEWKGFSRNGRRYVKLILARSQSKHQNKLGWFLLFCWCFFMRNATFLFRWMQQINQSGGGPRPKELKNNKKRFCNMEYERPSSYKLLTLLLKIYLLSGNRSSNDISITTPGHKMRPNFHCGLGGSWKIFLAKYELIWIQ